MSRRLPLSLALLLFAAACGGSASPAADPSTASPPGEATTTPQSPPPSDEDAPKPDAESAKPQNEEVVEPTFTPDMSVEDAIKAIPQSAERVNVDQETLSKPLQEESLYDPCKPGAAHFTLRVAVWRGKAVAIDLNTTPQNPKLTECLKGRIRDLTWPVKVPSLNTVEYSM
ncbi:MAG TPA: hypothetical protein VIK01_09475 [Polyangiaceae bacterium]